MLGDIAQPEQVFLAERRIVPPLGRRLPAVVRPRHHVAHRAHGAVAIQHFQRQLLRRELLLDAFECQSDVAFDHTFGSVVTPERPPDEIIRPGVADVLDDAGIDVAQKDKTAGQGLCGRCGNGSGDSERDHNCFHESPVTSRHGRTKARSASSRQMFRPSTSFSLHE